jgi:DNA ligase-associated metallophosphoesterase
MNGPLSTEIAGEPLQLLPQRAAFWPRRETLLVADPHFGKAAAFRHAGVPVPEDTTRETLARLDDAIAATHATRIIFLGDFFHARTGRSAETLAALERWRAQHAALQLVLVRGNHDRHAGDPPDTMRIAGCLAELREGPFCFRHEPEPARGAHVIAGHVHPAFALADGGTGRIRLPCFVVGRRVTILPAFGAFTGAHELKRKSGERIFVCSAHRVLEVPPARLTSRRPAQSSAR